MRGTTVLLPWSITYLAHLPKLMRSWASHQTTIGQIHVISTKSRHRRVAFAVVIQ
ncbi:hypothetical protein BDV09DRAFT_161796 [Aspergillus tetrazonus]